MESPSPLKSGAGQTREAQDEQNTKIYKKVRRGLLGILAEHVSVGFNVIPCQRQANDLYPFFQTSGKCETSSLGSKILTGGLAGPGRPVCFRTGYRIGDSGCLVLCSNLSAIEEEVLERVFLSCLQC